MNLLAQILSSKVRSEIFRLLFGTEIQELHLREIEIKIDLAIVTSTRRAPDTVILPYKVNLRVESIIRGKI